MKRMSFVLGLAAVAVSTALPAATVSVRSFRGTVYGPGEASDPLDLTASRSEDVFADAYIWMRGMAIDKNGELKAGENVFSFLNDTQSGTDCISIDSVWLEPVAPLNGTLLRVQ